VKIIYGVEFEFPRLTIISPKESIYIARKVTAFATRFGNTKKIVGPFSGRLDNGGEEIQITAYDGQILAAFTYQSNDPWPVSSVETGFILKRKAANIFHDGNLPTEWEKGSEPIKQVAP